MNRFEILYKKNTASEKDIYSHLFSCNDGFIPPLSNSVNIKEYSNKIFDKATIFEAWVDSLLVGFIAAYLNDVNKTFGFITNVSVLNDYKGFGIASMLLNQCIVFAKKKGFKKISLEVNRNNHAAIKLYQKFNFNYTSTINNESIIMSYMII